MADYINACICKFETLRSVPQTYHEISLFFTEKESGEQKNAIDL